MVWERAVKLLCDELDKLGYYAEAETDPAYWYARAEKQLDAQKEAGK